MWIVVSSTCMLEESLNKWLETYVYIICEAVPNQCLVKHKHLYTHTHTHIWSTNNCRMLLQLALKPTSYKVLFSLHRQKYKDACCLCVFKGSNSSLMYSQIDIASEGVPNTQYGC